MAGIMKVGWSLGPKYSCTPLRFLCALSVAVSPCFSFFFQSRTYFSDPIVSAYYMERLEIDMGIIDLKLCKSQDVLLKKGPCAQYCKVILEKLLHFWSTSHFTNKMDEREDWCPGQSFKRGGNLLYIDNILVLNFWTGWIFCVYLFVLFSLSQCIMG